MNVKEINLALNSGNIEKPGVFPHLEQLKQVNVVLNISFGLKKLPSEPGIITIRGARQSGKSTWMEQQIKQTIETYGAGSVFYLNGDEIQNDKELLERVRELLPMFNNQCAVRRLFIDEITAIPSWNRIIKRLADAGELKNVLLITTGSKATDLMRGVERLPGRKGKLERSEYLFLPVSFYEFQKACHKNNIDHPLISYLIAGGLPLACSEIISHKRLPEYLIVMMKDWIYGECAVARRNRSSLLAIMDVIFRYRGNPVGQAKLAREAGLANNTVAAGYIELLEDLMCATPCYFWDPCHKTFLRRKPYKVHFINLLAAVAYHPAKIRCVNDFLLLKSQEQGAWLEWLVAQELWRRNAIHGMDNPALLQYWQNKEHEIDYVLGPNHMLEVKKGQVNPLEFSWFSRIFPKSHLTILGRNTFSTDCIQGLKLEDWLAQEDMG